MIENCFRNLERGLTPMQAALEGARQIGFTVISISVSLVAAFIPLLFLGGVVGRVFREFSVTLAFAIAISTLVSLSVTPMICAHFVRAPPSPDRTIFDRVIERVLSAMIRFYGRTLTAVLRRQRLMLVVMVATMGLTVYLYRETPKGYIPQDDTGLIYAGTQASSDVSFQAMYALQQQVTDVLLSDPAVAGIGSSIGSSGFNSAVNRGSMFVSLKPRSERGVTAQTVIDRLNPKVAKIAGLSVWMWNEQDVRSGARFTDSTYQFTLWDPDYPELLYWAPRVLDKLKTVAGLTDVTTDRQPGGLQANVVIDRTAASRLGVRIQDIDNALDDAFGQRQISTLFTQRNQYRVVMEIDPQYQRDPLDVSRIYVVGAGNTQVPLSAVTKINKGLQPLVINHQGQFPSVTLSFNLAEGNTLDAATASVDRAVAEMHMPDTLHAEYAGDARAYRDTVGAQLLLIGAALVAVYIVLGVLYESLAHPLTIISTLPSAGLGALLALQLFRSELTLIAFIGIILLIGIVKKNGIMMVDFALEGERGSGLTPEQAIYEACLARFRPIMMTTMAALLGALPLVIATGPGSELRRPLGITIMGGLLVSQALTLYTTPVIYLWLDRLHRRLWGTNTPRERGRLVRAAVRALKA
jgi:multidrug efflux pump subunit AcrB